MTFELGFLDDDSANTVLSKVFELCENGNFKWALVGGLAMALYGSDRNTKDVDAISDQLLPLAAVGPLRQGGERYLIKTAKRDVALDWILRKDEFSKLFAAALDESVTLDGIPVLTPEWLVILKFIAGRFKDQEDAVFLLSRPGLVDRKLIKEKLIQHVGREAWGLARHGYQRWYEMADGRAREDERNEAEGFIDS